MRDEHHAARFHPLDEAGGNRRERAHHQQKACGEPLHGGFVYVEIRHDFGERDVEQRVVEVAEKRTDKQREDDELGGEIGVVAVVLCVGVGLRFGDGVRHGFESIGKSE